MGEKIPALLLLVGRIYVGIVYIFLLTPVAIIFVTSVSIGRAVQFPPGGLSLQWYRAFFAYLRGSAEPGLAGPILTSVSVAVASAGLALLTGVLASYALARGTWRGRDLLRQVFILPIVFPQIVTGIGLLIFFSSYGFLRGLSPFERLVLGHAIICLPYVLLIVAANLELYDRSVEEAAIGLGAGPIRTFLRITLPLIRPGIIGAGVFAFIVSFTNFTITFFLSTGGIQPLPLWLFQIIENFLDPVIAVVSVCIVVSTASLVLLAERFFGLRRLSRT